MAVLARERQLQGVDDVLGRQPADITDDLWSAKMRSLA